MIAKLTIYSIGHSNLETNKFLNLLKQFEIEIVVDVRSSPYSRYTSQFNRETLVHNLEREEIAYHFLGDSLGGRPQDPTCYKDNQVPEGRADYLQLVDYPAVMTKDWFKSGLLELIEIGFQSKTAILCSEGDPSTCHRHHLVGKALREQEVDVQHILKDGILLSARQIKDLPGDPPAEQLELF